VCLSGLVDVFSGSEWIDEAVGFGRGGEVDVLRARRYDHVLLAPTSFGSAWRALRGGIRGRHGFATSRRGLLLSTRRPASGYRRDRHQVENYRELAGLLGDPRPEDVPHVRVNDVWRVGAARLWPAGAAPRVVLQPGATYGPTKRWDPERFAAVGAALAKDGADVAVVGGPGDREPVSEVLAAFPDARDLCGRTSTGELAAVLEGADLVITNDTGPMHLAAAVGTPTVAIFGSTSPTWTAPYGEGHRVLHEPPPCNPCFQRECSIGMLCLDGVSAERVLGAAHALLRKGDRR
jgi:lipopolysaccharide heptosyltransferase II